LILEWALNLEQAGIVGTEFNFSAEEKQKAQAMSTTINIGQIGAFAGNLGSGNTSGDIRASDINVEQLNDLLDQLKRHSSELTASGADHVTLLSTIEKLHGELKGGSPDQSIIRRLLPDIRNALSGAAGNLIASGAINLINQVLGTGVPAV
jgi:hypothetical protein